MSSPCPTDAVACAVARSPGRIGSPSGAIPAAIAPDETRRISCPATRRAATPSPGRVTRARSSRPPTSVSEEDPSLTPTLPARGMPARSCRGVTDLLCRGRFLGLRGGPVAGLALGPQLLAGRGLGVHPLAVPLALLGSRRARGVLRLLDACVGAAAAEVLGTGHHGRLPVEDDAALHRADHHLVARLRTGAEELLFHPEAGQAVGEVAHRLVVGEVRLRHPPLRLGAAHLVEDAVVPVAGGDGEAGVVDGTRAQDDPGRLGGRGGGAGGGHETGQREGQGAQPFVGGGGDFVDGQSAGLQLGPHELGQLPRLGHVHLVEHDDARPLRQRRQPGGGEVGGVGGQLGLDRVEVAERVAVRLEGGAVEDVDDDGAALDVPQEVQPQPPPLARAGDEPGDVGHGVALLAGLDDAEVGHQRGEGVVGDLRAGGGHGRDEAGLARAGEADERDVRDALQLQDEVGGLPLLTEQGETGRLAPRGGEGGVAQPATAAGGGDVPGAGTDEVGEDLAVGGLDDGAVGDREHEVLPVLAVAQVAGALGAVGRAAVRRVVVGQQRRRLGVDLEDDVTTPAAVAAVGTAERLELLPADGGDTVATVAAGDMKDDAVDKAGHRLLLKAAATGFSPGTSLLSVGCGWWWICGGGGRLVPSAPAGSCGAAFAQASAATTLTVLRPRRLPNSTAPEARAKRVSSLPRPTLSPGWNLVPRWRTMISPALTT